MPSELDEKLENPAQTLEEYQKNGNLELRNRLVMHYSYIAKAVAAQMRGVASSYAQMEDIVNQGILTLMDCLDKFQPSKGVKFESYAFMRVKCANIDFIRKQDWLPRRVRKAAKDLTAAYDELSNQLMREPTVHELSEHMGLPEEAVHKHFSEMSNSVMLSFEMLLQNALHGADTGIGTQLDDDSLPETSFAKKELREQLMAAIDTLTEKERLVVSLYYYEHLKLYEIADIMGVSESRTCQTHSKAILKMRKRLNDYLYG